MSTRVTEEASAEQVEAAENRGYMRRQDAGGEALAKR
jgi:hypothetical protein